MQVESGKSMFFAEEQHVKNAEDRVSAVRGTSRQPIAHSVALEQGSRGCGLVTEGQELSVLNSSWGFGEPYSFEGREGHARSILITKTLQEADIQLRDRNFPPVHPNALALWKGQQNTSDCLSWEILSDHWSCQGDKHPYDGSGDPGPFWLRKYKGAQISLAGEKCLLCILVLQKSSGSVQIWGWDLSQCWFYQHLFALRI